MNRALWIAQFVAGVFFIAMGIMHFVVPEGLPSNLSWMYDLSDTTHLVSGVAELLGGLGLILPAVTRIAPFLVPLAALGLAVVMAGAIVYHVGRGETASIASNVVWLLVTGFIAYGRGKVHPIASTSA